MRTRRKTKTPIFVKPWRIFTVVAALSFVFLAVFGRLYYLHVVKKDWSEQSVEKVRNRHITLNARRGDITDAHGGLLATSRPVMEVGVDPEVVDTQSEESLKKLDTIAALLEMRREELLKKCRKSRYIVEEDGEKVVKKVRWVKLRDCVDLALYDRISEIGVKGIYGNRKYVRVYPTGALLSHAVGFVNKEFVAEMGVERQFDYYLRGQDGWREIERDGKGRELPQFRPRDVPPTDGLNVELTIDIIIQEMAQRELKRIVEEYSPEGATIIVGEPATGHILAMANYPNFDPNKFGKYPQDNLRNRAISDQYEPGSTFKIVSISAALNESLVGPDDVFDCNASTMEYRGRILRLPKEAHKMGNLSVREITKKSSNKGVAQLAALLGEQKLYDYARLYGFGEKTGLGLVGEIPGTLHKTKDWDGLTITRLPMGHAIAATPLQIHCAMCVIANDGIYMAPQIVKRVYAKGGETKFSYPPKAERRVISSKIAHLMSDMLSEVVSDTGTARRAKVRGFKVAGKTGTSQKIINGKYSTQKHVASFCGFFPAQRPRIAITVLVDSPKLKGVGYGGLVAAPAFGAIAEKVANYMGIKSDEEFEKTVAWKISN